MDWWGALDVSGETILHTRASILNVTGETHITTKGREHDVAIIRVCDITRLEGEVEATPIMVGGVTIAKPDLGPIGAKLLGDSILATLEGLIADQPDGREPLPQPAAVSGPADPRPDDAPPARRRDTGPGGLTDDERDACRAWAGTMTVAQLKRLGIKSHPAGRGKLPGLLVQRWNEANRPDPRG